MVVKEETNFTKKSQNSEQAEEGHYSEEEECVSPEARSKTRVVSFVFVILLQVVAEKDLKTLQKQVDEAMRRNSHMR